MKKLVLFIEVLLMSTALVARAPHNKIVIPNTKDFLVLKCDFHVHTIFSDGSVWPTVRVQEAAMEGLDAIAITDHIEYRKNTALLNADHNTSYELANKVSESENVIVIKGSEITRGMPPGHWNALFLKDSERLALDKVEDVFREARSQGAFLIWNHPAWNRQAPNETRWWPEHEKLYKDGYMMGIEVYNVSGDLYSPEAFKWAIERNLTIMCDTDCHSPMDQIVDYASGDHRPVTLVFAKERSAEGIREALDAQRTAAYAGNDIYGRERELRQLFESVITVENVNGNDKQMYVTFKNNSTLPVTFRKTKGGEKFMFERNFIIRPNEIKKLRIMPLDGETLKGIKELTVNFEIVNFHISPTENMTYAYTFTM